MMPLVSGSNAVMIRQIASVDDYIELFFTRTWCIQVEVELMKLDINFKLIAQGGPKQSQ